MPQHMWDHSQCCGDFLSGSPECGDGHTRGRYAGWLLTTHESMARYQYVYGLKPIGPHRFLADQLLTPLRDSCPRCNRKGILDYNDGATFGLCPVCEGTGGSWDAPDDVVNARRRTVLESFPNAGAPSVRFFCVPLVMKTPENIMVELFTSASLAQWCYSRAVEVGDGGSDVAGSEDSEPGDEIAPEQEGRVSLGSETEDRECPDPWATVAPADLAAALDQALVDDPASSPACGRILAATRTLTLAEALIAAAVDKDAGELALQEELPVSVAARFTAEPPSEIVDCCVSSSMTSGTWCVLEFRIGDRGYLYYRGDEEDQDALLAAWEPALDRNVRRACFLATYLREWRERCLPPAEPEWATGEPGLLEAAILHVVEAEPESWPTVVGRVSDMKSLTSKAVEYVTVVCGVPPEEMHRVVNAIHKGEEVSGADRGIVVALYAYDLSRDPQKFLKQFLDERQN